MGDQITKIIEALNDNKGIVITSPVDNRNNTLHTIAKHLFSLISIKSEDYIKHFDICKKVITVEDVYTFFSRCMEEHSYYIIWENAQNFTTEAWRYAVYKTNELRSKSIFFITGSESIFPIPRPTMYKLCFFSFSEEEINSFTNTLYRNFMILRDIDTGINLIIHNYGYKGTTVFDNKSLKNRFNNLHNQEEENNMKITGVYSNEKKGRTTIKFDDGRVVSVQCDEEDKFDAHKGIAMALAKAAFGSKVLQECLSSYSKQKSGKENKKAKKARKAKAKAKKEESSQSSKKKDSGKNGHAILVDRYKTLNSTN